MSGKKGEQKAVRVPNKLAIYRALGYTIHHREVLRFHNSKAKVKVCSAPRRTTKSYSAAHDVLPELLLPNKRIWIVGPNYGLAEKEFRVIHDALVINREKLKLPKPKYCYKSTKSGSLYIEWAHGAILEGKSADRPEGLLGEAVDAVIYSEAAQLPRGIRERYVQPTLITKQGREIIPTTPDQRAEWVHELVDLGKNPHFPEIDSFHWGISANPTYDPRELEFAKKLYGEDSPVFREQYLGEWVFYGGLVYQDFRKDIHIIEPFDIPASWPRIRGIDFGHQDPFVCLWCAVGPYGELYFYKEYYSREGKGIREHATRIRLLSEQERISMSVGDPAAKQSIEDLCFEGVPCDSANNDRTAGRLRVTEYMHVSELGVPPFPLQGKSLPSSAPTRWPRMYFFNTVPETIREMMYYRWKEHTNTRREGQKEVTEGEDHAMDPMRYILMTRPSVMKVERSFPVDSFNYWKKKLRTNKYASEYVGRY
jgi:phage terminase large subunit